jgi:glycosyl hydrolase family 2
VLIIRAGRRNVGAAAVLGPFRMRRANFLAAIAACLLASPGTAVAQSVVSTPSAKTLYRNGPSGRFLMDGTWLLKLTSRRSGPQRETSTAGWRPVTVPNAWNAGDDSAQSFLGGVGWYRKDFRLPRASRAASWVVRFESVNYRSEVFLNGRPIGRHRGAYLPFELRLPARLVRRGAVNRLVIRVDSRRTADDFPPSGLSRAGKPTGGWWNYGGLLREVYLRAVNDVDMNVVQVLPQLACPTCPARVRYRVTLHDFGRRARRVTVAAQFGGVKLTVGTASVPAGGSRTVTRTVTVRNPHLWSPTDPFLYDASLVARSGRAVLQRYTLRTGVRLIRVIGGRLFLNGQPASLRGVALHEDSRLFGFAVPNSVHDQQLAWVKEIGATVIRSHYPLAPYTQERADELGILQWSEIPVYSIKPSELAKRSVRALAVSELETNIRANGNHPSVLVWSIGNELSSHPDSAQASYIRTAVRRAHALDPTRPVGLAVAGYRLAGCRRAYAPLDVLGLNDYFGWYPGPSGQIADRSYLSGFLDGERRCYPRQALMVTEFGAEANRDGPAEERGTYAFQRDFVNFHLAVFATKPWLSGAIYFTLQEFRVRPDWQGGNPRPAPPLHQKGLITFDGVRKPAFFDVQRLFRATAQLGAPPT